MAHCKKCMHITYCSADSSFRTYRCATISSGFRSLIRNFTTRSFIGMDMSLEQRTLANAISCDLAQDIATFLHKHDTVIGSKGISLSTGQKQRIALARAVYSKKAFMILDDVFSGLDANTRQNIFVRLLGPEGALRRWKTTVLIASHSSEFFDIVSVAQLTIAQLTSYLSLITSSRCRKTALSQNKAQSRNYRSPMDTFSNF